MIELDGRRFVCELAAEAEPAVEVPPGSRLKVRCRSACDRDVGPGPVRAEAANPATGPIAVTGARAGHALRVEIIDVAPEPFGHVSAPADGGYQRIEIRGGDALFGEGMRVPLAPMIGVIGVAPAEGSWNTMDCGFFGGNLDTNDVAPGAAVFLPVFRPGGMLVLGDVHAVMGDGEIGGQGLEVAADVTIRVDIEPRPLAPCVYLYRNDEVITVGTGPTLDEACASAAKAMAGVLASAGPADRFAAMKLLGLAGELRVGQCCCRTKSARVALPLRSAPPQLVRRVRP